MMELLFFKLLDMSVIASLVIICVLVVRLFFKKRPAIFSYILWGVVLFRLLCPVSIESALSVFNLFQNSPAYTLPIFSFGMDNTDQNPLYIEETPRLSPETNARVQSDIVADHPALPDIPDDIAVTDSSAAAGMEIISSNYAVQTASAAVNKKETTFFTFLLHCLPIIWLFGCVFLLCITLRSLLRLRQRLIGSVCIQKHIFLSDHVPSAFVFGFLKPHIYLSSALSKKELELVLLHERMHIHRGDHLIKALFYLTAILYWFNPFVWIAFRLFIQDMELSCDEAVIRSLNEAERLDYAETLIHTTQPRYAFCPLTTFATKNMKNRILHVLHYQTPRIGSILLSLVILTASFLTLCSNSIYADTGTDALTISDTSSYDNIQEDISDASPENITDTDYIPEITGNDWINNFLNTGIYSDTLITAPLTAYTEFSLSFDSREETPASLTLGNFRFTFHQLVTDGHFYHLLMTVNTLDHTSIPYSQLEPTTPELQSYSYNTYHMNTTILTDNDMTSDCTIYRLSPYEETDELQFVLTFISEKDLPERSSHKIVIYLNDFFFNHTNMTTTLAKNPEESEAPCLNLSFDDAYVLPSAQITFSDSAKASASVLGMILTMNYIPYHFETFDSLILRDGSRMDAFPLWYCSTLSDAAKRYYLVYPYAIDPDQIKSIYTSASYELFSE